MIHLLPDARFTAEFNTVSIVAIVYQILPHMDTMFIAKAHDFSLLVFTPIATV